MSRLARRELTFQRVRVPKPPDRLAPGIRDLIRYGRSWQLQFMGLRIPFSICDGMKSFSNRRWANRKDLINVPCGTRECLQRARVAEGPEVR